jgi:hypothetical protein
MDLQEVGRRDMGWSGLGQGQVITNFKVSYNAGNFLTTSGPLNFSGRTLLRGISYKKFSLCKFSISTCNDGLLTSFHNYFLNTIYLHSKRSSFGLSQRTQNMSQYVQKTY